MTDWPPAVSVFRDSKLDVPHANFSKQIHSFGLLPGCSITKKANNFCSLQSGI